MFAARLTAMLLVALLLEHPAAAQWEVILLHPDGASASHIGAGAGRVVGGFITMPDWSDRPVIWSTCEEAHVDLMPPWAWNGHVHGMDRGVQVGFVSSRTATYAAMWHGSADTFVSLEVPAEYVAPTAYAVAKDEKVGLTYLSATGMDHAVMWRGGNNTFVDLHPAPADWSQAFATDGTLQGGWAAFPEFEPLRAVLWHGSADSFVDMNPAGARESRITGMAPGVQVGWGLFGTREFGVLWRGTPGSAVNMHPADGYTSRIYATCGRYHVGYVNYQGWAEAGVWTHDDPESFENLQPYLGEDWIVSAAYAVSIDNGRLFVGGSARRSGQREQAVLWVRNLLETRGAVGASSPI